MTDRDNSESTNPGFTIRAGEAADADELHRLIGLLAESLDDRHRYRSTPATFARYATGPDAVLSTLLAVDESTGSIGACTYLPDFSTWLGLPGVYILDLVVEARHRSRGVGRALLVEAARRGRDRWDADYLILSVARDNDGAVRFYEREGFEADDHSRIMIRRTLTGLVEPVTG